MKWLLEADKKYLWASDWKDWALVRFSLLLMGMLLGVLVHKKAKKPVFAGTSIAFIATVIPVIYKYIKVGSTKSKIY